MSSNYRVTGKTMDVSGSARSVLVENVDLSTANQAILAAIAAGWTSLKLEQMGE